MPFVLPFSIQPQQQSLWCWAAVAASVSSYYDATTTWEQCRVADALLAVNVCCSDPLPCNEPNSLRRALEATGNLATYRTSPDFNNLVSEVVAGRPVAVRIAWAPGRAHYVVIDGLLEGPSLYVRVRDPALATPSVWRPLDALRLNYRHQGVATHVYETRAA